MLGRCALVLLSACWVAVAVLAPPRAPERSCNTTVQRRSRRDRSVQRPWLGYALDWHGVSLSLHRAPHSVRGGPSRNCRSCEAGYMPLCKASRRRAAWRHVRVRLAKRSRIVPFKRSIKAVLSIVPPAERRSKTAARLRLPEVTRRVTCTTRFLTLRLITVPMTSCGQTCKQARPHPGVGLTFSRKARRILPG